jgi:hypothetical protein
MIRDALPHRWRLAFESPVFAAEVVEGLIHHTLIVHVLNSLGEGISLAHQVAIARARRPVLPLNQRSRDEREQWWLALALAASPLSLSCGLRAA